MVEHFFPAKPILITLEIDLKQSTLPILSNLTQSGDVHVIT
ncbi:hypothetical protein VCR31J2_490002 [Vibrio coralliirubri]|uniref:Uncharacterized protein n=1 Tax=Vibrio coralliirubri TaxID=1516159 RepID=A0AA86X4L8_9VIBR|nr:hypothetical protein VCR1J2_200447 [Vibrio coralliirubri]CDT16030.1 hypothetical protein VCR6J2_230476 [Vibrio coralliirubri]CDT42332.1 hypothetical protein VCR29J2_180002 [Vibrio coralliirubri]CDT75220.1 hypothetical protein VCR8J2_190296 [Vibrio coralliirubri]CDT77085.1 hypothetical protein VCR26J2_370358 [Vibrio coralliirubri]